MPDTPTEPTPEADILGEDPQLASSAGDALEEGVIEDDDDEAA